MRLLVSLFPQSISSSRFFPTESEKSKGSRSSQIKLHILLSCHLLPRNSPPRSNQNYSKARFKAEGVGGSQGSEAGGDGWVFSAMFVQCIAGAADGRGSNRPPRMKTNTEER